MTIKLTANIKNILLTLASLILLAITFMGLPAQAMSAGDNPNTNRKVFLHQRNSDTYIGNTKVGGSLIYSYFDFDVSDFVSSIPQQFNYTRNYQLKFKRECLSYPKSENAFVTYLYFDDCNDPNLSNQFKYNEDGTIEAIDNPGAYFSHGHTRYAHSLALSSSNQAYSFDLLGHPFKSDNCTDNQLLVEGKCVCDPTQGDTECSNNDGETCSVRRQRRLGEECVDLRLISKINRQFWRYFNQGFWVN